MITRLGREIDNPDSVYYWAFKVSAHATCQLGASIASKSITPYQLFNKSTVCTVSHHSQSLLLLKVDTVVFPIMLSHLVPGLHL